MSSSPGIHDTLGAAFIGLLLYGITILQAYQYFLKYPNDTKVQKGWVVLLFLLDTANIVFGIHAMYFYLIFRFGDLSSLQTLIWSIKPFGVAHVLVIWIVQRSVIYVARYDSKAIDTVPSLYLWRIWRLTNSLRLPTWIVRVVMIGLVVIVLVGLAAGVVFLVELEKLQSILIPPSFAWVILFLGCLVPLLVDMSIATTMFFLLWSQKVDLPSRMDRVVATLVTYIVSTGVLTSLMKLVYLLIFSARPDTLLFLCVEFSGTRLYVNSYYALLNARKSLRDELDPSHSINSPSDIQIRFARTAESRYSAV
ncbi:hypothetical protein PLEOSDRAFT_1108361 [Pleurotus ostreatus PC15]|uniref:DUF6534 domain-containing protein n=1 Tax=Pleurotus ostreatus (strain PC15) TaxID=1137138 RepID=A0A067NIH0_PLEO1|nr:hypothetical protein PLEOSDRAFT_1108361 [Pleurotus ostreatus PC15]